MTESQNRRDTVNRARTNWINALIDLSRRNNLLYFRDLTVGSLELTDAEPQQLNKFLAGEKIPFQKLLPQAHPVKTNRQVRTIARRALTNLEERGISTLFLGAGMATWSVSTEGRPPAAAVVLIPVTIEMRGREWGGVSVRRVGEIQINSILLYFLAKEFGCTITPEWLLEDRDTESTAFDPEAVYSRMYEVARGIKGFNIDKRFVLGNFSFQKMAMVRNLQEHEAILYQHPIVAALAGDHGAQQTITTQRTPINPNSLDDHHHGDYLVLDADSSQSSVIAAALADQSGVIQGPPGTGKSQTIVNLIATLAAQGKKVLFVAEKRAALEVVLERLKQIGLGHLALDLHGADISRKLINQQFSQSLTLIRETREPYKPPHYDQFEDRRNRLQLHNRSLHTKQHPSELSAYDIKSRLIHIPKRLQLTTRWRGSYLEGITPARAGEIINVLDEAKGFKDFLFRTNLSPWVFADLSNGETVQAALDITYALVNRDWVQFRGLINQIATQMQVYPPQTIEQADQLFNLAYKVANTHYQPAIFQSNVIQLISDLEPATKPWIVRIWSSLFNSRYKSARNHAQALRLNPLDSPNQLLDELKAIALLVEEWNRISLPNRSAYAVSDIGAHWPFIQQVQHAIQQLSVLIKDSGLFTRSLSDLDNLWRNLANDSQTAYKIPHIRAIERQLAEYQCNELLDEFRQKNIEVVDWVQGFEYTWLNSWLDAIYAQNPSLAAFDTQTFNQYVSQFVTLDQAVIHGAIERVNRSHAEHVIQAMNEHPEQAALVWREAEKRSRHLTLRSLLAQAPDVLPLVRPCWMASPYSVSQLIQADYQYFDVIIFDEASQVLPQDAIPAIMRAKRIIVAGDKHQLPPTIFFVAGTSDDEQEAEPTETQGFESLLDICSAFLEPWMLNWHYRSRDEALIAFSNQHIYQNRLISFPSPHQNPAIHHVLVDQSTTDGPVESGDQEVQTVISLILDHALRKPQETLGVITLGINHAQALEAALETALDQYPHLEEFFNPNHKERFFIKNLERVQGDERDSIILSIGYGKDRHGKLLYRFGPLLYQGGERRLNVAITRARNHMTVVSSFSHHDMAPERSKARGVQLLRGYLEYAAELSNTLLKGRDSYHDLLIQDLKQGLIDAGLLVESVVGASRYPLDLIIAHPQNPSRFLLAIETDGLVYHSLATVRDRERLRAQQLRNLGWHVERVWIIEWTARRDLEIARLKQLVETIHTRTTPLALTNQPMLLPARPTIPLNPRRSTRPLFEQRSSIDEYPEHELLALVRWIKSDGQLRTDEHMIEELVRELGFKRRGSRIDNRLRGLLKRQ